MVAPHFGTLGQQQHKLIYEFIGSRNLNTTPLDVTGLDGDKWDYMVEMTQLDSGVGFVNMFFNNDLTTNYRDYGMRGQGSSASAAVNDSRSGILVLDVANESPNVLRCFISGDSSSERYADIFFGSDHASSDPRVYKKAGYWKNQVDNLTSIKLTGSNFASDITLRIYQVPKQANLDNYDLVDVKTLTSESADQTFSGLDGDADGEYLLEIDCDDRFGIELNGDGGLNYIEQRLYNFDGSIGAQNGSQNYISTQGFRSLVKINAVSGRKRLASVSASILQTASEWEQTEQGTWWTNTVDNITSIVLTGLTSTTGRVKLYKRKSNRTIDPVPMRTVVEHDISGVDFSAGITISGIEGDRIDGAIKVEFVGVKTTSGATDTLIQLNGDVGSNYTMQRLAGGSSGAEAGSLTSTAFDTTVNNYSPDEEFEDVLYFYTKSGQNRPVLFKTASDTTGTEVILFGAGWWNNSVDEITSMKIYASNTNTITGKIRISVPENTRQSINSWQVTVN